MTDMLNLDLGAGANSPEGFRPMGRAHGSEIFPLPVADGSVDVIRASHCLEHFPFEQTLDVLKDWVRALKPGGTLQVAVPDFAKVAEAYLAGVEQPTQHYVMGGHIDANDHHGAIFDRANVMKALSDVGLVMLRPWQSDLKDCAALPISLNIEGKKPHNRALRVRGLMSAPRLGYNDMWNCAMQFLPPLGVPLKKLGGAFWGQVLTMGMEMVLEEDKPDYILTLDYDSVFTQKAAADLIQLAMVYPDADAIVPVQSSRHNAGPLFSFHAPEGTLKRGAQIEVPAEFFGGDLSPVRTGHFGLTLLKAEKIASLPKPWFCATPNAEGRWDDGKTDDDTSFWRSWEKAGNSLMLAPRVAIGHLELMVRWPDLNLAPQWQSAADWEATRRPPPNTWEGY
jgi:SAM-dependent methyltransferase